MSPADAAGWAEHWEQFVSKNMDLFRLWHFPSLWCNSWIQGGALPWRFWNWWEERNNRRYVWISHHPLELGLAKTCFLLLQENVCDKVMLQLCYKATARNSASSSLAAKKWAHNYSPFKGQWLKKQSVSTHYTKVWDSLLSVYAVKSLELWPHSFSFYCSGNFNFFKLQSISLHSTRGKQYCLQELGLAAYKRQSSP